MTDLKSIWPLLAVGGAAVAGAFGQVKSFFGQLRSLIIVKTELNSCAADALAAWLWKEARRAGKGDRHFILDTFHVRKLRKRRWIIFETTNAGILFVMKNKVPIYISSPRQNPSGPGQDNGARSHYVMFVRGSLDIEALLVKAAEDYNNGKQTVGKRFFISKLTGTVGRRQGDKHSIAEQNTGKTNSEHLMLSKPVGYDWCDLGENGGKQSSLSRLALPPQAKYILQDIKRWRENEEWYEQKGIPWRYGLGLYGPGGTGKSSLAGALAREFDLPLYILEIATMDNADLIGAWSNVLASAPCEVLLEDIDTVFHLRKPANSKIELTFECLLNCISGVESANGVLTVITTNNIHLIDPALGIPDETGRSSRPGRIDAILKLDILDEVGRIQIANNILADTPEVIDFAVKEGHDQTGAQFENLCRKLALDKFWNKS